MSKFMVMSLHSVNLRVVLYPVHFRLMSAYVKFLVRIVEFGVFGF